MAASDTQIGGDHYRKHKIQPWDAYREWLGEEGFIAYLRGNIFSYLVRYKDKGGVEDLKKALHDLNKLIELESEKPDGYVPSGPQTKTIWTKTVCTCGYQLSVSDPYQPCPMHPFPKGTYP